MLDQMRRSVSNVLTKLLLGLLIVAFAVWGIGDYVARGPTQSGGALATIGDKEISVADFRQAYQEEVQALGQRLNRTLTPEQAQLLGVPPRALARLIGLAAIDQHARALGLAVSDDVLRNAVRANPTFAGPTGEFSRDQFRSVLRQRGFGSEDEYFARSRSDLLREQVTETLEAGVMPQRFLVDAIHRYRGEARVIEYLKPDFDKLVTVPEPDEKTLKAYFERSKGGYKTEEERQINLLLASRETAMARVKVTDDEVKAAYDANKEAYDIPEKRVVQQLTFPDKAAAEKAYAELVKAEDFEKAAAKLGFKAGDLQLGGGPLTKAEMIDAKIADAAFALEKGVLSKPVEGNYSVVLLRVPEIVPAEKRTFDQVKGELRNRLASERVSEQLQTLYDRVEAGRASGTPLKEIAQEVKLPLQEISGLTRSGKTSDGKDAIAHADAARIVKAVFAAEPGMEPDIVELNDEGLAWFDLVGVTPPRQQTFEEVADDVKARVVAEERAKAIAKLASEKLREVKPEEGLERIAKELNAKIERTPPLTRTQSPPPDLTRAVVQRAFGMAKGDVSSAASPDGRSRVIFQVVDTVAAPKATADEAAAITSELTKQMRMDLLDQYVTGLRARYGFTVDEKRLMEALGTGTGTGPSAGG